MISDSISKFIAQKTGFSIPQIRTVGKLFDEGATVPFIARYRRELTGDLDEEQLRLIRDELEFEQTLADRKVTILETIDKQDKLTDELRKAIEDCRDFKTLEDLYLPYKPKRKTRSSIAKEKGLEPLALLFWEQEMVSGKKAEIIAGFVNPDLGVSSATEAIKGAQDICAEWMNENAEVRERLRKYVQKHGSLGCKKLSTVEGRTDFENYYEYNQRLPWVKPHQVLAINRGERESILLASVAVDEDEALALIEETLLKPHDTLFMDELIDSFEDAWKRLLFPSLEREVRSDLSTAADLHAIQTFATNVKNLLLQPPLAGKIVMGIDPAFRTGCKIAIVDDTGKYLEGNTVYPTPPHNDLVGAAKEVIRLINTHKVELIAIGNGTGSRETEQFVANVIAELKSRDGREIQYLIVSEAGASVYSASKIAREEFPDLDAAQRGNISIARRIQDPLAELVKIDPKSIGVGLYQHDVNQSQLSRSLDDVVESCVNTVGVNLNTASAPLLTHVSGLSKTLADHIVETRNKKGKFSSRAELMDVPGMGPFRFEQAAGFLRIPDAKHPLDNTAIHPESYSATERLCDVLGIEIEKLDRLDETSKKKISQVNKRKISEELGIGVPTMELIIENLLKPGRDPREEMPKPLLRTDVVNMDDLRAGQELQGTVRNVVDFGAFVDLGVKQDGLLHISKMGRGGRRVTDPHDELAVGDIITVTIEEVDLERGRIALGLAGE